jgi:hypothetical protein
MHENVTHNKTYPKFRDFAEAVLGFLRKTVPQRFDEFSSTITYNFRVIDPNDFRTLVTPLYSKLKAFLRKSPAESSRASRLRI